MGPDPFEGITKQRALRRLWARCSAALGADTAAQRVFVHAVSGRRSLARRDPWVNLLRLTAAGFAASVGGADAVTTSGFDEPLGPTDAFGRRLAINTQLLLAEEAYLGKVIDPAGGSWYLEAVSYTHLTLPTICSV